MTFGQGLLLMWVASAVLTYPILREVLLREADYTRADRRFVVMCAMFGPVMLVVGLGLLFIVLFPQSDKDEVLAKRRGSA